MPSIGYRTQVKFWLNLDKDVEYEVAQIVENLKAGKQFAPTIRNAIRLINDLRAGRVAVLQELFPWVFDAIAQQIEERKPQREHIIENKLSRIEELMRSHSLAVVSAESGRIKNGNSTSSQSFMQAIGTLQVVNDPEENALSAQETRANFTQGIGDLFAEDDDIWDD